MVKLWSLPKVLKDEIIPSAQSVIFYVLYTGVHRTHREATVGHEGEKRVTISRYS